MVSIKHNDAMAELRRWKMQEAAWAKYEAARTINDIPLAMKAANEITWLEYNYPPDPEDEANRDEN